MLWGIRRFFLGDLGIWEWGKINLSWCNKWVVNTLVFKKFLEIIDLKIYRYFADIIVYFRKRIGRGNTFDRYWTFIGFFLFKKWNFIS